MQLMCRHCWIVVVIVSMCFIGHARAIILVDKTYRNKSAPTGTLAGSGWQWQGNWGAFTGTPIAKNYFIAASHIGGSVGQTLTLNGKSYTTNVWMRTQSGSPTGKVTLQVTANGTTNYITLAQGAVNSSGWTLLAGTATVSWSGTLSSARFYVETTSGTDSFLIDDASIQ